VKPKGPSGHCFSLFAVSFSDQSAVVAIVSPRRLGRSGAGGISSCGFIFSSSFLSPVFSSFFTSSSRGNGKALGRCRGRGPTRRRRFRFRSDEKRLLAGSSAAPDIADVYNAVEILLCGASGSLHFWIPPPPTCRYFLVHVWWLNKLVDWPLRHGKGLSASLAWWRL